MNNNDKRVVAVVSELLMKIYFITFALAWVVALPSSAKGATLIQSSKKS